MKNLVLKNRSCRRFYQDCPIESGIIRELIGLARLCGSAGNLQPLRYMFCCDPERNSLKFPLLVWARHMKDWPGPSEGEKPAAYVVVLGTPRSPGCSAVTMALLLRQCC